jgi:hypothetical protein
MDKFIGFAYQGKDIVFRFTIEYSRAEGILAPYLVALLGFLKDDILACVET